MPAPGALVVPAAQQAAQAEQTKWIEPQDKQVALRDQGAFGLAQHLMGPLDVLQGMGQQDDIQAIGGDRQQITVPVKTLRPSRLRVCAEVIHHHAVRDP